MVLTNTKMVVVLVTFFLLVVSVTTTRIVVVDNVNGLPQKQGPCVPLLVTVVVQGTLWNNDANNAAGVRYCTYCTSQIARASFEIGII